MADNEGNTFGDLDKAIAMAAARRGAHSRSRGSRRTRRTASRPTDTTAPRVRVFAPDRMEIQWSIHACKLGTMPDICLAEEIGCDVKRVTEYRKKNLIPRFTKTPEPAPVSSPAPASSPPSSPKQGAPKYPTKNAAGVLINWSQYTEYMGVFPDADVAEMVGCHRKHVAAYRRAAGIAPYVPKTSRRKHDLDSVREYMGVESDGAVAARVGCSAALIYQYRKKHGIPSAIGAKGATVGVNAARNQRGCTKRVADFHDLVGTVPDSEIAKRAKCSVQTVFTYRKKHGIAPFAAQVRRSADFWEPWMAQMGTVTDREMAEIINAATGANVTRANVSTARYRFNIPAKRQKPGGVFSQVIRLVTPDGVVQLNVSDSLIDDDRVNLIAELIQHYMAPAPE